MPNYAFTMKRDLPTVENGHHFIGSNFEQLEPHTAIFAGVTGLKFTRCRLVNCDVPLDAILEDCANHHINRCTNLDSLLVSHGLTACVENCSHVVDTDTVEIDGQVVDTIYHYKHTVVT